MVLKEFKHECIDGIIGQIPTLDGKEIKCNAFTLECKVKEFPKLTIELSVAHNIVEQVDELYIKWNGMLFKQVDDQKDK